MADISFKTAGDQRLISAVTFDATTILAASAEALTFLSVMICGATARRAAENHHVFHRRYAITLASDQSSLIRRQALFAVCWKKRYQLFVFQYCDDMTWKSDRCTETNDGEHDSGPLA